MLNIYEPVAIEEERRQCWIYVCYRIMHVKCGISPHETKYGPGGKMSEEGWEFTWEPEFIAAYDNGLRPYDTLAKIFNWDRNNGDANWKDWIDFAAYEEQLWHMEREQHGSRVENTGHVVLAG